MKKSIFATFFLILFFPLQAFSAAGTGFSSWTAMQSAIVDADLFAITDVSDTTQSSDGSSRKVTGTQIKSWLDGRYATYPGAGIPNSTGSAWGTSYTLDTDLASVSGSDDSLPSAKATKTYADTKSSSSIIRVDAHASAALADADVRKTQISNCSVANSACQNGATTDVEMTRTLDGTESFNFINSATLSSNHTFKLTLASRYINLNGVTSTGHSLIITNGAIGDFVSCAAYPVSTTAYDLLCTTIAPSVTAP